MLRIIGEQTGRNGQFPPVKGGCKGCGAIAKSLFQRYNCKKVVKSGEKRWSEMLLGEFEHSLDDKGRLFIPARLRDALGKHFYLCKGFDGCLMVYDEASWQRFTEKLNNLSMGLKKNRDLKRFFFSGASDVSCDKQGRVLLAASLRRYAGIDKRPGNG